MSTTRKADQLQIATLGLVTRTRVEGQDRYASCGEFADALRMAFGLPPYDSDHGVSPPPEHPPTEVAWTGDPRGFFGFSPSDQATVDRAQPSGRPQPAGRPDPVDRVQPVDPTQPLARG